MGGEILALPNLSGGHGWWYRWTTSPRPCWREALRRPSLCRNSWYPSLSRGYAFCGWCSGRLFLIDMSLPQLEGNFRERERQRERRERERERQRVHSANLPLSPFYKHCVGYRARTPHVKAAPGLSYTWNTCMGSEAQLWQNLRPPMGPRPSRDRHPTWKTHGLAQVTGKLERWNTPQHLAHAESGMRRPDSLKN